MREFDIIEARKMMTEYVVKTSRAKMPGVCWGKYCRVAVLEVYTGSVPTMISECAIGVKRIVKTWEKLNMGTSDRCAASIATEEAQQLADKLNAANYRLGMRRLKRAAKTANGQYPYVYAFNVPRGVVMDFKHGKHPAYEIVDGSGPRALKYIG